MSWRSAVCIAIVAIASFSTTALGQVRPEAKKKAASDAAPAEIARERFRIIFPPQFDATNRLTPVVYALHGYGGGMDRL